MGVMVGFAWYTIKKNKREEERTILQILKDTPQNIHVIPSVEFMRKYNQRKIKETKK